MRETSFIEQNKDKWSEFEEEFDLEKKDPEKLSQLFIQITDDLSYARTYYPNRSVKVYLNGISQKVFFAIYRNRIRKRKRFAEFWFEDLPKILFETRKQLLFTFILFSISMAIGIFSSSQDPEFCRQILGDSYVDMTEENIKSGDPMQVYKKMNQVDMFLGITMNNLRVAFLTFIFGLVIGFGTSIFIIYNGVMVGAFQYFFIERDLFQESFLTIWVHGGLEISAIIIAGSAGITLGKGLIFPHTYSRLQSFRMGAAKGLQILLGIVPILILAAFIEGFLTRYTSVHPAIRAIIIALELLFMITYYVIYPYLKSKKGFVVTTRADDVEAEKDVELSFQEIKTNGKLFSDGFLIYKKYWQAISPIIIQLCIAFTAVYLFILTDIDFIHTDRFVLKELAGFFNFRESFGLFLSTVFMMSVPFALTMYCINICNKNHSFSTLEFWKYFLKNSLAIIGVLAVLCSVIYINSIWAWAVLILAFPYCCFILLHYQFTSKRTWNISSFLLLISPNLGRLLLLYSSLLLLGFVVIQIVDLGFTQLHLEIIKWNIPFNEVVYQNVTTFFITLLLIICFYLYLPLVIFNMGFVYFSNKESKTASHLLEKLELFSNDKTTMQP